MTEFFFQTAEIGLRLPEGLTTTGPFELEPQRPLRWSAYDGFDDTSVGEQLVKV